MRVLFLEDEASFAKEILAKASDVAEIVHCQHRDEAFARLESPVFFDLAVLDLRVPPGSTGTADSAHGNAVFEQARKTRPGMPIWFLTAFHSDNEIVEKFRVAERSDIFGSGDKQPLVDVIPKSQLERLFRGLSTFGEELERLNTIEINYGGQLSLEQRRILRIFTRSIKGTAITLTDLSPGLSGASVFRALVTSEGRIQAATIAKIASHAKILDEKERYRYVAVLEAGSYAPEMAFIESGAGAYAGLFYRLAENYEQSLLDILQKDQPKAARLIQKLREIDLPWFKGNRRKAMSLRDLRSSLVEDADLKGEAAVRLLGEIKWPRDRETFERHTLDINFCIRHGDLHCENVLVSASRGPLLIDYGKVGHGPAALDPITLEVGLIFHPSGQKVRGKWPTPEEAAHWPDWQNQPTAQCPVKDFVVATRAWRDGVSAGPRETLATYYAIAMRQIRFPDTDKATLVPLIQSVVNALEATYA